MRAEMARLQTFANFGKVLQTDILTFANPNGNCKLLRTEFLARSFFFF